jgi:hypothetical protein
MVENAEIIVALISIAPTITIAVISIYYNDKHNRRLADINQRHAEVMAELEHRFSMQRDDATARRDYKYSALKRLYNECEPLMF